jgi:hypothetical protein
MLDASETARSALTTVVGSRTTNMLQGELQGALGNLRTICGMVSPLVLGQIYAWSEGSSLNIPCLCY